MSAWIIGLGVSIGYLLNKNSKMTSNIDNALAKYETALSANGTTGSTTSAEISQAKERPLSQLCSDFSDVIPGSDMKAIQAAQDNDAAKVLGAYKRAMTNRANKRIDRLEQKVNESIIVLTSMTSKLNFFAEAVTMNMDVTNGLVDMVVDYRETHLALVAHTPKLPFTFSPPIAPRGMQNYLSSTAHTAVAPRVQPTTKSGQLRDCVTDSKKRSRGDALRKNTFKPIDTPVFTKRDALHDLGPVMQKSRDILVCLARTSEEILTLQYREEWPIYSSAPPHGTSLVAVS